MNSIELTENELKQISPGDGITLAGVMAIIVISIVAVICYRLFMSGSGSVAIPGGFKFTWK